MKINSLSYHFHDFHTLLSKLSEKFDIVDITEIRLKTHALTTSNINFQEHFVEYTATESTCGGSLLYININHT